MSDSTVISVRISKNVKQRLARVAESMKRSQSFIAAEAIEEFVAVQEWQIAGIKEALASLDRGEGIPHEEVKRWVDSLNSEEGNPAPKPDSQA